MRLVILGMGNTLFSDDGVGIAVVRELKECFYQNPQIEVLETSWGGFRIIDLLSGYDAAIIVDAFRTGQKPVGSIHHLKPDDLINSVRMVSFHDINFVTALEFARQMDIPMPEYISIYAIEVAETELISEEMTPEVIPAIQRCTRKITKEIENNIFSERSNDDHRKLNRIGSPGACHSH
jgi:hydrogenase maturation protease